MGDLAERGIVLKAYAIRDNNSIETQVGGTHYQHFAIQPIEFIIKNKLGFVEGNIIKYICRYKYKNEVEDLLKIKHYIDLLLKLKYGKE